MTLYRLSAAFALCVLAVTASAGPAVAQEHLPSPPDALHAFSGNVAVRADGDFLVVESDGIPDHETGPFPNPDNPNRILRQAYRFRIPLRPRFAPVPTPLPMGPVGVAVNGVPFYNPYNAAGHDAVAGPFAEVFDSCCGHPDPRGRYHYHKYPVCAKTPFRDEPGRPSPLIGFAFDGFAIYGPNCQSGEAATGLDECNGHECDGRGYHYHVTDRFPYILGGYRGVAEAGNFDAAPFPWRAAAGVGGLVGAVALVWRVRRWWVAPEDRAGMLTK